jgi:hypothetical protein
MKLVQQIGFSEIFRYAEKYGVTWNVANDLFFNNVLQYKSVTDLYGGDDWRGYTNMWKTDKPALEYTVEEVQAMEDLDKAWLIIGAYLNENNIEGEVQVDCR